MSYLLLRNWNQKVWTQYHSEKEIIFQLFTFADTDVFFLACEIHLCQDQYCSMPTRSQGLKNIQIVEVKVSTILFIVTSVDLSRPHLTDCSV